MIDEDYVSKFREYQKQIKLANKQLADAKKAIVAYVMQGKQHGTSHIDFESLEVKATIGLDYKVDKDILLNTPMTDEEKNCIEWKPVIKATAYKELVDTENHPTALQNIVVIKPKSPTLEINDLND